MTRLRGKRPNRLMLALYTGTVVGALYLPIVVVALLSVNDASVPGFPIRHLTLRWFRLGLSSEAALAAIGNSIGVGVISATVATGLALMLALSVRRDLRIKGVILNVLFIPVILPGVVAGAAIFTMFRLLHLPISLWTSALCGHITYVLPFAFLSINSRLQDFDHSIEEAARDLGATARQVALKITIPMISPAIVAAWLFAFSLSFDEFVRTLLLTSYDRTLPIQFWYMIVETLAPEAPAMAVIIIVISVATSVVAFYLRGHTKKRILSA
jgi:spermidine/putrescine transport system permease protein